MTDLTQRISAVLDSFFSSEKQFTLLDVSNAVKNDGGPFLRHTEVRDAAKPILDIIIKHNSVYEVHQIEVNTPHGKDTADLYTPYFIDASDYAETSQVASAPKQATPVVQSIKPVNNVVVTTSVAAIPDVAKRAKAWKLVKPRSDGAICVPKTLLEEAGLMNDDVGITNHPNSISLTSGGDRWVDEYTEFRVYPRTLKESNVLGVPVYVCAFSDKIVIAER